MPPSIPSSSSSTRTPGNHIPRPPNAFICFRMQVAKTLRDADSRSRPLMSQETKAAGEVWQSMSDAEKQPYVDMAARLAREHKLLYPEYKYAPGAVKREKEAAAAAALEAKERAVVAKNASKTRSPRAGPSGSQLRKPHPYPVPAHSPYPPAFDSQSTWLAPFASYASPSLTPHHSVPGAYEFTAVDPAQCQDFEALYEQYLDYPAHCAVGPRRG